ncbi:protein kinase domain-containing protein [Pseudoroseomonas cervicalis]|uniref:protein kinase domain-containing protein n=1 Tax=Teichococcus cervicalis TaxID=204525 RepID=UPI00278A6BB1|nr:SIR2 family protein [Pseudoroseomonas cervicalis]MDQ1080343.1 serine/threonine protein kinase [Pseudoroseomonas cervicalis]
MSDASSTLQRLKEAYAERRRPVVFWVGAGLSAPASLPTWGTLRDNLVVEALEGIGPKNTPEAQEKENLLEIAKASNNYWDSFETVKTVMGKPNFIASIRRSLKTKDNNIPDVYKEIWSLRGVNAVLTLNMDKFVERAHRRMRPKEDPVVFSGRDAPSYMHVLGDRKPFIANLHGTIDDQNSWIFTKSEVDHLYSISGYQEFITTIFASSIVVFIGISADDAAAGGNLYNLTQKNMDLGEHFWITHRTGISDWASRAGIQVISYEPDSTGPEIHKHTNPLCSILREIKSFKSRDKPAASVLAQVELRESLDSPRELRMLDDDDLRLALSGHARYLVEKFGPSSKEYNEFLVKYASNIHQSWHISTDGENNTFYGYKVLEQIHGSSFSTVWKVEDSESRRMALKLLRIDNIKSGIQIDSFRRGVQSLQFLTNSQVPATARLFNAFEIPTSYVMEYVDGSSLQNIIPSGMVNIYPDCLNIMSKVCAHLYYSHNLPQSVLHRDIRPSNIMLPYIMLEEADAKTLNVSRYDVVLLNYDMSWHSNAAGETIAGNMEEAGYYAPEQLVTAGEKARSTYVDSYGVGMTLFYAFSGISPPNGGSNSRDWLKILSEKIRNDNRLSWRSAPARLRRLIQGATEPEVEDRLSITRIKTDLEILSRAISGNLDRIPVDFWAEEIMFRCEEAEYQATNSGYSFVRNPRAGRSIVISGDEKSKSISVQFKNQAIASTDRKNIDRLWFDKLSSAKQILQSHGWDISNESRYGQREILLFASVKVEDARISLAKLVTGLQRGLQAVRLD